MRSVVKLPCIIIIKVIEQIVVETHTILLKEVNHAS